MGEGTIFLLIFHYPLKAHPQTLERSVHVWGNSSQPGAPRSSTGSTPCIKQISQYSIQEDNRRPSILQILPALHPCSLFLLPGNQAFEIQPERWTNMVTQAVSSKLS